MPIEVIGRLPTGTERRYFGMPCSRSGSAASVSKLHPPSKIHGQDDTKQDDE